MAQFVPYLKPYIGELLRMDEQTEFLWYPVDPGSQQTGVNYQGYVINPTERVLSPICVWSPPGDTGWHIVAGFALFASPTSPDIINYLCFEARIYDDTSSGYTVDYRWTIRQNDTGYPLLFNFGTATTVYSIPGMPSKDNPQVIFNQGIRNDHYWIAMGIYCRGTYEYGGDTFKYYYPASLCIKADTIDPQYGYFDSDRSGEKIDDPNKDDDEEKGPGKGGNGGGGGGKHKLPDDPVPIPPLPGLGSASVSWLTVYMMDKEDIDEFGQELVTPTPFQQLKQYFNDPLDAIVGIMLVPATAGPRVAKTPRVHGTPDYVWSRSFMAIGNQYARVNCGNILIEPYWDSAFDFDPYTRFTIFLPFIGYKTLKADDIMGANVQVEYHIDVCTGDCTAYIVRSAASDMIYGPMAQQVIAQFSGNCGVRVPIGRISHDAAVDASMRLLSAGIGIAGGAAMAGLGLVDAGNISMSQASNQISGAAMSAINAQKRSIERSGALGGNTGYMGVLKPYLIRQIPRQFLPDNYKQLNGYPANKGGTLDHFRGTGYQAIETIELDNLAAYDSEIDEIRTLLKGGVLV